MNLRQIKTTDFTIASGNMPYFFLKNIFSSCKTKGLYGSFIIEVIKVDARIDSRISADIKRKASKVLADHGLPKYWDIPNVETMSSIEEAIDDLKTHKLEGTTSYPELEKLLDE